MRKLMDGVWEISPNIDLCHHEPEENYPEEWYFQRYPDHAVSQSFTSKHEAMIAWNGDCLKWTD